MFPVKPGSTGLHGRPTLMFYRHYWKIAVTHNLVKQHPGLVLDLEKGNILKGAECNEGQSILLFDGIEVQIKQKPFCLFLIFKVFG